ncbi:MAG TPA: hypothetical protein DCP92_06005, partial [Nitrospiraceae bacterium]|nr:hypothetical protein [Nitrospiraceae bacterium]
LSALLADYRWIEPTGFFLFRDPADMMGMVAFLISCTTITFIAEAMHRARARASEAEAEAKVATERKRSEEQLRENEERLDLALRSAYMGVWHWDIKENRRYFDDQVCHLLGIVPESFTGTAEEFFAVVHTDDREKIVAALNKTIEQDVPYESEYRVVWPDRSIHYITARGKLVRDKNDQPAKINGVCWDITDRKRAEESLFELNEQLEERVIQKTRFHAIVAGVNDAIFRHRDRQELFREVCRIMVETGGFKLAWIGTLDMTSREMRQEASWGETSYLDGIRIVAADVPEGRGPTGRAIAEGRHVISADFEEEPQMLPWRERARAHGIRSSSAFPLYSDGSVAGALTIYSEKPSFFTEEEISLLLSVNENISFALDAISSEKKRLEAEESLRLINEELERRVAMRTIELAETNKELEGFSYSVSHDLRAPLRHMSGFVQLLRKKLREHPDEQTHQYTDAIAGASKKMGMLIDDLLAFSKIGRTEMKKRKVSLDNLVREAVNEIQDDVKGRNITWEIDELPDIYGDQSLLRLVFVNLLSNAVKYTSTRPQAEIKVGWKDEGSEIICSVKDNGVGFNMAYVDKLFGVFQRLHTQDEFEGTGIGLANVQRIISRHDGRTWAEGAEGQGATFYFTLPKKKES